MLEGIAKVSVSSPFSLEAAPGAEQSAPVVAQPTPAAASAPVPRVAAAPAAEQKVNTAPYPATPAVTPPATRPPQPVPKINAAQAAELENLATVHCNAVLQSIAHNDPDTEGLRRELRSCAKEMLTVQNAAKLHTVLRAMMKLALRCERAAERGVAMSIYQEVLSYVPPNAPRDAQHIRGICLQRLGKMESSDTGMGLLQESLNLLDDPKDRGGTYLFLGMAYAGRPAKAMEAYEQAFRSFQLANDVDSQAKAIVHWAGEAAGLEPDLRLVQRLSAAVQLLGNMQEPVYEANAYLELGRAQQRLRKGAAAWEAYSKALDIARSGQQPLVDTCVAALDALATQRYWARRS